jgi:uncharacterized membrane protein YgcG
MKKYLKPYRNVFILFFLGVLLCNASSSEAQVRFGINVDVQNYVPPSWAPPYDNESSIRYYYLPDYDMYYDVWDGDFWYAGPDGAWISSEGPPPQYAGVDFGGAFIVLIDRHISRPWTNYSYYRNNYPEHGYDNYTDIVVRNRIVTNTEPGHRLVPRAFNENSNRVTFMQRRVQQAPDANNHGPANYHRVVHEVPIKSIAPSMPATSRNFNYGRGYAKPPATPRGGNSNGGNGSQGKGNSNGNGGGSKGGGNSKQGGNSNGGGGRK